MTRLVFTFCLMVVINHCLMAENKPGQTFAGPGTTIVEEITIMGSPATDPMGNLTGITIPLKRAGRLFVIEGSVNEIPGNFILDTGASGLVLNKTYFRSSVVVAGGEGGGVTGSTGRLERMYVKRLSVSDLVYSNVAADVTNLGHLENRRGIKILGLFGMSLLKNVEIVIDLKNNQLQVFKVDKAGNRTGGNPVPAQKFDATQKITVYQNIMFVKARVGGKELDFCLDTGAESNLIHCSAPRQALDAVTITRRTTLRGAGPEKGEILMGILDQIFLGNKPLGSMETAVCSLSAMSDKYGYTVDGMLGYDFFMKGKFFINLVKKEMGICLYPEETR